MRKMKTIGLCLSPWQRHQQRGQRPLLQYATLLLRQRRRTRITETQQWSRLIYFIKVTLHWTLITTAIDCSLVMFKLSVSNFLLFDRFNCKLCIAVKTSQLYHCYICMNSSGSRQDNWSGTRASPCVQKQQYIQLFVANASILETICVQDFRNSFLSPFCFVSVKDTARTKARLVPA